MNNKIIKLSIIKSLKEKGYSMRNITTEIGCSVGTVHRILKLKNKKIEE